MRTAEQAWTWVSGHATATALAAMAALLAAFCAYRVLRRAFSAARGALKTDGTGGAGPGADLFIVVAALLAQAVVLNGMWGFAGTVLHFGGAERASLFAFLDVAIIACAVRARRNMRKFEHAGVEGTAVWVLSAMSGVFSAMAATSAGAAAFRLAAPLVAAWLWHRAMSLEKQERTGRTTHWRLTAERILVRLRLADPEERVTTEVAAYARLAQLARAVKKLRALRQGQAKPWRQARALRRVESALSAAVEHAQLASSPARQEMMRDLIGSLCAAGSLAELDVRPPWDRPSAPARTVTELFDEMASTITPVPETPDPGPDRPLPEDAGTEPAPWLPPAGPLPEGDGLHVPPWADEALAMFDEPPPDETDLDAEAAELFGPSPAPAPAPVHHEDRPRTVTPKTAARVPSGKAVPKPPAAKWTPEGAGLTVEQVRRDVASMSRNKLAEQYGVGRSVADRIRAEYGPEPALNGSR